MKYLFSTVMTEIDADFGDLFFKFIKDKIIMDCSLYAAGRLGIEIGGIANGKFWFEPKGYKLGSICFKVIFQDIKISILIFKNKKMKISMGFPKTDFDYDNYMKQTIEYLENLLGCTISNISVKNITVQKQVYEYSFDNIIKYLKRNNDLFQRIIYPDFLVHTHHFVRCYVDDSTLHCAFDSKGTAQILGAKSKEDVLKLQNIIEKINFDLFLDELML